METVMENKNETVVAVLANNEGQSPVEEEMSREVSAVEKTAKQIVILDEKGYEEAAAFGRMIKQKAGQITDFFAPMKKAANDTHKSICAREKTMLAPLVAAEKIVKQSMSGYIMEQERKRKEEEERLKKLAQEEADRKLCEALALEGEGKIAEAEAAFTEADIVDNSSRNVVVEATKPKAEGTSSSIDWEIVQVDSDKVPVSYGGMCLRPVDTQAAMKLIRASKGKICIPGIEYKPVVKLAFRK